MKYGMELLVDLHTCHPEFFRQDMIKGFIETICKKLNLKREGVVWWDDKDSQDQGASLPLRLRGISCVQFIRESSITIHAMRETRCIYINIFACKAFDAEIAKKMCEDWFGGKAVAYHVIERW